jgi:hypothetical protein
LIIAAKLLMSFVTSAVATENAAISPASSARSTPKYQQTEPVDVEAEAVTDCDDDGIEHEHHHEPGQDRSDEDRET